MPYESFPGKRWSLVDISESEPSWQDEPRSLPSMSSEMLAPQYSNRHSVMEADRAHVCPKIASGQSPGWPASAQAQHPGSLTPTSALCDQGKYVNQIPPQADNASFEQMLPTLLGNAQKMTMTAISGCKQEVTCERLVMPTQQRKQDVVADKEQPITTLMVRNLPEEVTQVVLIKELHRCGFKGAYDYIYLPVCFNTYRNNGFGFINFVDPSGAAALIDQWHLQHRFGASESQPALNVSAAVTQGFKANLLKWSALRLKRTRNPNLRPWIYDQDIQEFTSLTHEYMKRFQTQ
jgi:hypothetical protein